MLKKTHKNRYTCVFTNLGSWNNEPWQCLEVDYEFFLLQLNLFASGIYAQES